VAHGTAVASLIAASPVPGVAFAGLAPGARVLPVRVTEEEIIGGTRSGRPGTVAGLADGVHWAVDHDARVLNLSLAVYQDVPVLRDAIEYATEHDVVVVAAVGNGHTDGGPDRVPYPAGYPGVLGVGAIGSDGVRSPDSPVGSFVDIVAPGAQVTAVARGHGLASYTGTSFATPFVAATAALIRQREPALPADRVVARILATTDPSPAGQHSDGYGYGVLDPYRAVTESLAVGTPDASPATSPAIARLAASRDHARIRAAYLAVAGAVLAGLILTIAVVVPRGRRRHWRPGT
jgi:subtilisin family serine protease